MSGRAKRKRPAPQESPPAAGSPKKQKTKGRPRLATTALPQFSPHPHGEIDTAKEYRLRKIIQETKTHYLIDWEDDESTGEPYEPTWEPRRNANRGAIEDWELRKKRTKTIAAERSTASEVSASSPAPVSVPLETSTPVRNRRRPRPIIDSSPTSPELTFSGPDPVIVESPSANPGLDEEATNPLFVTQALSPPHPASPPSVHPVVNIGEPQSSILAGEYQRFSVAGSSAAVESALESGSQQSDQIPAQPSDQLQSQQSTQFPPPSSELGDSTASTPAAVVNTPAALPRRIPDPTNLASSKVIPDSQSILEPVSALTTRVTSPPVSSQPDVRVSPTKTQKPVPVSGVQTQESSSHSEPTRGIHKSQPVLISSSNPGEGTATSPGLNGSAREEPDQEHQSEANSNGASHIKSGDVALTSPTVKPWDGSISQAGQQSAVSDEPAPSNLDSQSSYFASLSQNTAASPPPPDTLSRGSPSLPPDSIQQPGSPPAEDSSLFAFQTQILQPANYDTLTQKLQQHDSELDLVQVDGPSSLPQIRPSQPITLGESAPPRPTTPSITKRPDTSSLRQVQEEKSSQANPTPRERADQKLRELRAWQRRGYLDGSRPSMMQTAVVPPSQEPKSSPAEPSPKEKAEQKLKELRTWQRTGKQKPAWMQTAIVPPSQQPVPISNPSSTLSSMVGLPSSLRAVAEEAQRSPSSVPATNPEPIITTEEMNTSERFETLIPQALIPQVHDESFANSQTTTPPIPAHQTGSMHVIPMGLLGLQRDQYLQEVYHHGDTIQQFLSSSTPDPEVIAKATTFVESMRRITLHPDLGNVEAMTQKELSSQQAQWDTDCSTKFRFLKHLMDSLSGQTVHVVIVCGPGQIMRMLGNFIGAESGRDGLTVTLCSTTNMTLPTADLVIAMDPTMTSKLLTTSARCTIAVLLVPSSAEHVEWSLSRGLPPPTRLRSLVSGIYRHRAGVGKLEDDQMSVDHAATALAEYLRVPNAEPSHWPIPTVGILMAQDSQTESDSDPSFGDLSAPHKRPHEGVEVVESGKKARIHASTPAGGESTQLPGTVSLQELDLTHISDSIGRSSGIERPPTENELRLKALLQDAQARIEERGNALSVLQYDHEEQRMRLHAMTTGRNAAITAAENATRRALENANKVTELRAENRELREQLDVAKAQLRDHTVPEQAAFHTVRLGAEKAQADKEKADARLETIKRDLDYAQEMYQNASSNAQALTLENTDLADRLARTEHRAAGNQLRLRQMGYDEQTNALRNENRKLKALRREQETAMKFRDEELARLKGRIIGVRGGSRQSSPAVVGEPKGRPSMHPLRGP